MNNNIVLIRFRTPTEIDFFCTFYSCKSFFFPCEVTVYQDSTEDNRDSSILGKNCSNGPGKDVVTYVYFDYKVHVLEVPSVSKKMALPMRLFW
jgi:hypothetical protein